MTLGYSRVMFAEAALAFPTPKPRQKTALGSAPAGATESGY